MRTALFLISLAISDLAKTDLSDVMLPIVFLFTLFVGMDLAELIIKNKERK